MAKSLVCKEKMCTDQLSNSKNPERPQMDDDRIISMIKIKKKTKKNKTTTLEHLTNQEHS